MIGQYKDRTSLDKLCKWAEVAKSSFHYKAHPGQRGMKASTHTLIGDGIVDNSLVVDQIRVILQMDYCVYGYQAMAKELKSMEYVINKKKVYRLMKENHLLCGKRIKVQGKRKWVTFRRIEAKSLWNIYVLILSTCGYMEKADGITNLPLWMYSAEEFFVGCSSGVSGKQGKAP